MKFIDLFAGLGGFHKALSTLGHKCVFACEIDPLLRDVYEKNWKIRPEGDIRKVIANNFDLIPEHDILCAGFPCQPFSKAGKRLGTNDEERGTLFDEIIMILKERKPKYFILENVPHIARHDDEETWTLMKTKLEEIGYQVDHEFFSPHDFGIPQHRKRMFIVGSIDGLTHFSFDDITRQTSCIVKIEQFIEENPKEFKALPKEYKTCIDLWQKFINALPKDQLIPGFPIWGMEFGATYPYIDAIPSKLNVSELGNFKGNFGTPLNGFTKKEQLEKLPSYARVTKNFPSWKRRWIGNNRDFYNEHKRQIKDVVSEIARFPNQSWQKLEWNVGDSKKDINSYILQFRASGLRVKKADVFPSLVTPKTQIPIIGWKQRYITREEGLKLQSLEGLELPENDSAAFRALGNAVNAHIVRVIAEKLISEVDIQNSTYSTSVINVNTKNPTLIAV